MSAEDKFEILPHAVKRKNSFANFLKLKLFRNIQQVFTGQSLRHVRRQGVQFRKKLHSVAAVSVLLISVSSLPERLGRRRRHGRGQEVEYLVTGTHPYPPGPGVALTADTKVQRMPSESAAQSLAVALPTSQTRGDANRSAPAGGEYRHPGASDRAQPAGAVVMEGGNAKNSALMAKKAPTMPKPQWHPPWKLYRVISGHLGWVRCIAVEPGNQWFVTGSADRTIKIWDLASGKLKLSLTGHISTVRGVIVSTRSPYLFSCGEDKQVKCWDLEYNKVIRHYHGHLSAVYGLDLHPTIDVLVTCSRDSTARSDQSCGPLAASFSGPTRPVLDSRFPDLLACFPHWLPPVSIPQPAHSYTFASGSPDNIKQWKFPDGSFIQNLSGHNAIINTLTVNSDGVLVSGADNGTMHLWDWRTGYNFQRVHAAVQPGSLDSESGIFACAFDQSESRLLTAEADKTIKVYREDDTAARDGGAEPEVATVRVSIAVLDVNDNRPAIHLLFLTEGGAARVSEGARAGDYVARVSVSDADGDPEKEEEAAGELGVGLEGGSISLVLEGGEGAFALRSGGSSGVFFLCVEGPLDRESRDLYDLRLVATDAGSPPLSTEQTLLLRVADLNDQPPLFSQEHYRASVSEAAVPGTAVLWVSASDADEPGTDHARLRYTLVPLQARCSPEALRPTAECGPSFTIDPESGVISTTRSLDREIQEAVELKVVAQDLGEPPLSATCLVSIAVDDVSASGLWIEGKDGRDGEGNHASVRGENLPPPSDFSVSCVPRSPQGLSESSLCKPSLFIHSCPGMIESAACWPMSAQAWPYVKSPFPLEEGLWKSLLLVSVWYPLMLD
ncbi:hypothetical protein CB1_001413020 [Camelus ferus]|nr:hypothetical protein CB1_001413020 [Camelus ferus]